MKSILNSYLNSFRSFCHTEYICFAGIMSLSIVRLFMALRRKLWQSMVTRVSMLIVNV